MKALLPGVWSWSVWQADKAVDFNGYYVQTGAGALLIDPPPLSDAEAAQIEAAGPPTQILLTNRDHRRAAPAARERFGAALLAHEADAPLIDVPVDGTFSDGEELLGLRVVHLPDQKSPGECAFYWPERRALFLGDALWGKPAGALTMLPAAKYADVAKARAGLARLGALEVEAVLMGDGTPILESGGQALHAFLAGT